MKIPGLALCAALLLLHTAPAAGQTYRKKTQFDFEKQPIKEAPPSPKPHGDKGYQEAWSLFYQGKSDEALQRMSAVLKENAALSKDATQDLIFFYAWSKTPTEAKGFFEASLGAAKTNEALYSLGLAYQALGQYQDAAEVYKGLSLADPKSYEYQYERCVSLLSQDFYHSTESIPALRRLTELAQQAPAAQQREAADLLLDTASQWLTAAKKTKARELHLRAEEVYQLYVKGFPKDEGAYEAAWSLAELSSLLGASDNDPKRWSAASEQYRALAERKPSGKYTNDAVLACVRAFKFSKEQAPKKSLQVYQLYLKYYPNGEDRLAALYQISLAYQASGQTAEAYKNLQATVKEAPKSNEASLSVKLIYELLTSQKRDAEALFALEGAESAGVYLDDALQTNKRQLQLKRCEAMAPLESAACYVSAANELKDPKERAATLYRAAVLYQNAEKHVIALRLFLEVIKTPNTTDYADALLQSGKLYATTLDFAMAPENLERFATQSPGEPEAPRALSDAAKYRAALGEYDAAADDLKKYLNVASKQRLEQQELALAFFQIAQTRHQQAQENPSKANKKLAAAAYEQYLKDYSKEGGIEPLMQARARLAAYLRQDGKRAEADRLCKEVVWSIDKAINDAPDKSKLAAQLNNALDAAAECQFYLAEAGFEKFVARKPPNTPKLAEWFEEARSAREEATLRYLKIKDYGSKEWTLAGLARIGQLSYLLAGQLAPLSEELAAPIKADAEKAFSICVEGAIQASWPNEWSTLCEEELHKISPEQWTLLTEWTPAPTYEATPIIPVLVLQKTAKDPAAASR